MPKKRPKRGGARPGAGRPPGPDGPTVFVGATIPEALVGKMDKIARREGWTRSKAVTEAIRRMVGKS